MIALLRRILRTLAHWFDPGTAAPVARKRSWFSADLDTLRATLPHDPDAEEAAAWDRAHFKINGRPLP